MRLPSHFTSANARASQLRRCRTSPQAAFLSTRSLAHPCTRLPPVPSVPVLYPVRRSRQLSSSLSSAYSAYAAILKL
ncbi:hypothetical protein B0H14DRAFT_3508662 [Mycena olivaceomarginata]|nr:hypothetical protein B0H14DRAFT_3508662 [Mycena olivaceomarginata]